MTSQDKKKFGLSSLSLAITLAMSGVSAAAMAEEAQQEEQASENIEKIAVVGSRAAPRSVGESPVPVDIIGNEEFTKNGTTDMNDLLGKVVPSYNVNTQPISDAATLVRPANMRGLAPDHTLILVNGKRRHRAAVISFLGGGVSNGAQGPDISVIPSVALKQVEVLRDGAAAQYGSDAIAGVINFQLKDNAEGGTIEARYGEFYEGDGASPMIAANVGMPLTDNGFFNISAEYKTADATSRSVQRDDAAGLIASGNTEVANPAQIWGAPETKDDFKFFFNAGLDLNADQTAYMFGNWARRDVEGGFYFRNPNTRGGVYAMAITDENDDPVQDALGRDRYDRLVGDLTADGSGNCPVAGTASGLNIYDDAGLQAVMNNPNCFVFNEMFPGGFTPRFGGVIEDTSLSAGVKGTMSNNLNYDFGVSYGKSDADFYIKNTVNASMGPDTPTEFSPGRYVQIERGASLDFSYFEVDEWSFAAGLEFRRETFEIYNGDPASFELGPLYTQGFGIGSNGFPGFKPQDSGSWSRNNYAAYFDAEHDLTDTWLVTGALRYEYYDDFGSTTNWKLSSILNVTDDFSLRAAASTGFRAPTVGQSNVRNVTTAFSGGQLEDQATLPPTNPISVQKGATPLDPETSVNLSFGAVLTVGEFFLTADYFHISLEDRITQSSNQELTQADKDALIAQGVLDANSFSSVLYFTNDFDTTTQGVDLVASYAPDWLDGANFALAYNWTETTVDSYNPDNISEARVKVLEEALPHHKGTLTWTQEISANLRSMVRMNYYGEFYEDHLDSEGELPIYNGSTVTFDAEIGYDFNDNWSISVGAQNLFDTYPDDNPWAGIAGAAYPVTSPYGFNGGYYYGRLNYNF
ncbi:TonB-dependent receptor plug domain-containing protein [Shewanella sp.]|uniref:TonB-dependent receptor plug domain-containing protein n=1 Tax=Shewanella sp. TaxID=50422 RepID=UPI0035644C82